MINPIQQESVKPINSSIIILGIITLFGAFLRLYHIGYKPFWLDEAVIYGIANNSLKVTILQNGVLNSAPPFYVILINFVLNIGDSEEILRLVSWIGGVASIPAIYFLSSQFIKKIPTFITCFLVAVAPTQVKYSQELREYSLTFFFSILMLLFFYKISKNPSWKNTFVLSLIMIIGVFLQYGLSVLIISLNVIFLIEFLINNKNRGLRLLRWTISQMFVLGSAIFIVIISLSRQTRFFENAQAGSNYLSSTYWDRNLSSLLNFSFNNTLDLFSFAFPGWIFFFITIIGFIYLIVRKGYFFEALMMLIIPMILTYLMALFGLYPFHGGRQDIFLTPMIYLLFGFAIDFLFNLKRDIKWILLFLCLIPIFMETNSTLKYLNYSGSENIIPVIETLSDNVRDSDVIYVYYSTKPAFNYYYKNDVGNIIFGTYNRGQVQEYYKEIDKAISKSESSWLVFTHCYGNECNLIPDYVRETRNIELIVSDNDAYLYHVEPLVPINNERD